MKLSDSEKKKFLKKKYYKDNLSATEIAREVGTYPNRIRRDLKRFDIDLKTRSDVVKEMHKRGVVTSPTKGRERTEEEKQKIGLSKHKAWQKLSPAELKRISKIRKESWNKRSEEEKQEFIKSGRDAILKTQKTGSKLENFLHRALLEEGYNCQKHTEFLIANDKMHFDLFIHDLGVVIEIDGPAHSTDIWGKDKLARTKKSDRLKNAQIMDAGFTLIRIEYVKKLYKYLEKKILDEVLEILENPTMNLYFIKQD